MPRIKKAEYELQELWEDKIRRAKAVRKQWKDLFRVDLARQYYDGKQMPPGVDSNEWITINNVYAHIKAQLPALYAADPYFYVRLKRSFSPNPMDIALWEQRAKMRQAMLNYLKGELEIKKKVRLSIQDAYFSYGVEKTHYESKMIKNEDAGKPIMAEDGETPLIDTDTGEPLLEPEEIPINSRYKVTRIHPDDFLWDEDAGPLEDTWNWVAQCIREPLEEAKKNPLFNKTALKKLEGRGEVKDDEVRAREERKKGDIKGRSESIAAKKKGKKEPEIVARWEIYNLKRKTWTVIAEGGEIPLLSESALPPGVELHPFEILRFTLRDDSPYPIPPISQGIDPSREYNQARSDIMKHRKRFNRKYEIYSQGVEDEAEFDKLESGQDGTLIKKRTPEPVVTPIKDAPLDQMRYQELNYLKMEMIELFGGSSDEARGIAGAESATQAGILDKRLEIKEGDAMSMVIDFVKEIARKLDQLVQAHITKDEAVRITGPQGEFWELVRTSDYEGVNGEFEYDVNVGSTIPRMPQMERASWTAFLTLLSNFPHLMTSKHFLKRMAEMHHIEDESMIEELYQLGQQIMGGQVPYPGNSGSQPGASEDRPVSAMGGQAMAPMGG